MSTHQRDPQRKIYLIFLGVVSVGLAIVALMLPSLTSSASTTLGAGQVAPQEYLAPFTKTFTSEALTEKARRDAANAVHPVYTPANTSISRQQLEKLRSTLAYISNVRVDSHATINQQMDDLAALDDVNLSQETALSLLLLTDARWEIIQQEAPTVLERLMRGAIRPQDVENARNSVQSLVSLSLAEDQVILVTELVTPFITQNSEYSETLTEAERQGARDSVEPVSRTFIAGQTIVERGQVLTEEHLEALEQLGLVEPERPLLSWIAASALALLMAAFVVLYLIREPELVNDLRALTLILVLFFLFLYAARFVIPAHTVIPYAFPVAAFSLTVAALFGFPLAIIFSIPLAILVAYDLPNSLDLTLYLLVGSLISVLALSQANRLVNFLWAGLAYAISGSLVIVAHRLLLPSTDMEGMITLFVAAFFNGLVTASLSVLLMFLLAYVLGITTQMQLMDLTRPDQPLLQFILREAPGTYQHSLQLANLTEQAAERVGADPLLTRVGALYHDAGKALNPAYFIENQVAGFPNPHDTLDPETSSRIIIQHVIDGLELGKEYRLPRRVLDFISEHHGTMLTRYQYINAVKAAGGDESKVDMSKFRYPGPRPQSRESAILMLADGSEARVRAERPLDEEHLRNMVGDLIDNRVTSGQLDNTDLTLNDLDVILESFISTLKGVYHPRVKYPELDQPEQARAELPAPEEDTIPLPSVKGHQEDSEVSINTPVDTHHLNPE